MEMGIFNAMTAMEAPFANIEYLAMKTGAEPLLVRKNVKVDQS